VHDEPEVLETEDGHGGAEQPVPGWDEVLQSLKDRRQALAEAVFREVRVVNFDKDLLELEFPIELATYADFRKSAKHFEELNKVLEVRFGMRPRLEFRVAGGDGLAGAGISPTKVLTERANEGASPARPRPSQDVFEATPETVPKPEAESPRGGATEGADAAPGPETGSGPDGKATDRVGADDIIRDPREVLSMARELFGPGRGLPEDKQNGGK
jgi:hypothetical protein